MWQIEASPSFVKTSHSAKASRDKPEGKEGRFFDGNYFLFFFLMFFGLLKLIVERTPKNIKIAGKIRRISIIFDLSTQSATPGLQIILKHQSGSGFSIRPKERNPRYRYPKIYTPTPTPAAAAYFLKVLHINSIIAKMSPARAVFYPLFEL